jgi:hypothetical protein
MSGGFCFDHTSSGDFLFRLEPGLPARFDPSFFGPGSDNWGGLGEAQATRYQGPIGPSYWPVWGSGRDLRMGHNGPPGTDSYCMQGRYAGNTGQVCGATGNPGNWGLTQVVVYYAQ